MSSVGGDCGRLQVSLALDISGLPQGAIHVVWPHCEAAQLDSCTASGSAAARERSSRPHAEPTRAAEPTLATANAVSDGFVVIGTPVPESRSEPVASVNDVCAAAASSSGGTRQAPDLPSRQGLSEKHPQSGNTGDKDVEVLVASLLERIEKLERQLQQALVPHEHVWIGACHTGTKYHTADHFGCGGFAGHESKKLTLCKTCLNRMTAV